MTDPRAPRRGVPPQRTLPRGEILGVYETHAEAQTVVERLARAEFDVAQLSIVGSDLKSVERVTGRITYPRAALGGAASGAWFGLFAGVLLTLFSATIQYGYVIAAILIGAGFGMMFGIVRHALGRRQHDYSSTHEVLASRYEVIVPGELLIRAQTLLAQTPPEA